MGNCCDVVGGFFNPPQKSTNVRVSLPAVCFVWQIAMIVLFGVFIRYDEESDVKKWIAHKDSHNITSDIENDFYFRYPSKYCWFLVFFIIIIISNFLAIGWL